MSQSECDFETAVAAYIQNVFALISDQNKAVLQLVERQAEVKVFQGQNHFIGRPDSSEEAKDVIEAWMDCKIN